MEKRQVDWKRVKTFAPHCPKCKEQLSGNNSLAFPYQCSCGVWRQDLYRIERNIPGEFEIIPHSTEE